MLTNKSGLWHVYRSMAATAAVYTFVGGAIGCMFNGQMGAAAILLGLALAAWPFRMKVTVHRIKADSFEEAMREIAEIERREGR